MTYNFKTEHTQLEYKEAKKTFPNEAWKTICAFSNTKGGLMVLGIAEIEGEFAVTGVESPEKIKKEYLDTLNSDSKINLTSLGEDSIEIKEYIDGKKVIEIRVPEASYKEKPIYLNGQANQTYIRRGSGDYIVNEDELATFFRNKIDNLDEDLIENYDMDDLDSITIDNYIERLVVRDKHNRYVNMEKHQILSELGVIRRDRKTKKEALTFGGLLFFGKYDSIKEYLPHFHLEYIDLTNTSFSKEERYKDRVSSGSINFPNLNLYNFYFEVQKRLSENIKDIFSLNPETMIREENATKTNAVLREALANTIIHADYKANQDVKIEVFNHYYDFTNPGKMRVSTREFFEENKSKPRNAIIEVLFRKIGISERMGSGGITIYTNVVEQKLRLPELKSENNTTSLRVWKVDIADSDPELSEREKTVLKYITKKKIIASADVMKLLGVKRDASLSVLNGLIDKGYLSKHGQTRSIKYHINEKYEGEIATMEHMIRELKLLRKQKDKRKTTKK